jgi:hypothetical protein
MTSPALTGSVEARTVVVPPTLLLFTAWPMFGKHEAPPVGQSGPVVTPQQ